MTTNLTQQEMLIELINLEAILNLPKGTELYISDIHGEFSAFDYILGTCAGNLKEKLAIALQPHSLNLK